MHKKGVILVMEIKYTRSLLEEVNIIAEKYDFLYQKTGGYFNIFNITNIEADEVRICRLFKELLDPHGCHCQGVVYLKLFIKYVLHMDKEFSEVDYKTALVEREYLIDDNRRIDLVICINKKIIPIEVKVYARDQENQCKDYLEKAKGANLYYLTLKGSPPSLYSIGEEAALHERVTTISFEREILLWLDQCLKFTETKRLVPVSEVIRQFIETIRRLTNRMEEGKEKEVVSIISESSKNMKTAMMIDQSLQQVKIAMISRVFETLDHKITERFVDLGNRLKDVICDYEVAIDSFYANNKSSWPGLTYCCKKNVKQDVDLCFRVEIDYRLFCGFCTPEKNQNTGEKLSTDEAKGLLKCENLRKSSKNNWWIHWEYLPNEKEAPNFKEFNDDWYDLFDEDKFTKFIEKCIENIERVLNMRHHQ